MNRIFSTLIIICTFMLGAESSYAGLFAKGGGGLKTINSISPASVFNVSKQTMVLSGRFSKKQGRNRRVVISADRLPTPFPVRVTQWKKKHISVTIPRALQPGQYHIFLQGTAYRQNGQPRWKTISNQEAFEVIDGSHVRKDGLPHAAPIRVRYIEHFCVGPPIKVRLSGGPFQRGGKPINGIRAEVRTTATPANRMIAPSIRIISNTELIASVVRCQIIQNGIEIRLIYPDRSASNWADIKQKISNSAGMRGR